MRHVLWIVLVFAATSPLYAQTVGECGEPPPVADDALKGEISGRAQLLSRLFGSAELQGEIETSRKEIFSRYPNAERSRSNAYLEYQICLHLMRDSSMTTREKIEKLIMMRRDFSSDHPKSKSSGSVSIIDQFFGTWINPDNRGVTRLNVRRKGDRIVIHIWGRCHPEDCDWGFTETELSDALDGELYLQWNFSFAIKKQRMTLLDDNTLELFTRTEFTDDSGRRDRNNTVYLHRQ